jgi:hypothetical protein
MLFADFSNRVACYASARNKLNQPPVQVWIGFNMLPFLDHRPKENHQHIYFRADASMFKIPMLVKYGMDCASE